MAADAAAASAACSTLTLHRLTVYDGCVPSNLAIDDRLLDQALQVGGFKTKRETVNEALREFIQRRQRQELVGLFGSIDYDRGYDYKKERRHR